MSFGGLFFTNKGKALQAKAQTGVQLNFTRIGIGDGELSGQDISELTNLIHQVKSLDINKFKTLPGGKAVVGGVLSNQGLITGFYWRELGLFATDPDVGEILYCYGNAGALAEYIPADGGAEILEKQVNVVSLIGNAANVTATIEQSLIYATQEDINDLAGAGRTTETVKGNADAIVTLAQEVDSVGQGLITLEQAQATHSADYVRQPGYGTTAGSANTYTLALDPALSAYVAGVGVAVKINATNTASSTININGLGAKTIKDSKGNNLVAGKLILNGVYTLRYDGTNFILQGEGASGNAIASDLLLGKTAETDAGQIIGTIPSKGAQTYTPGTANQTIAANQFLSGIQTIAGDADLAVANIKKNINLFNFIGTYDGLKASGGPLACARVYSDPQGGYVSQCSVSGLAFQPKAVYVLLLEDVYQYMWMFMVPNTIGNNLALVANRSITSASYSVQSMGYSVSASGFSIWQAGDWFGSQGSPFYWLAVG